jgi:protein-L-isoaspartate(D-aspartate) O-methyltransferase
MNCRQARAVLNEQLMLPEYHPPGRGVMNMAAKCGSLFKLACIGIVVLSLCFSPDNRPGRVAAREGLGMAELSVALLGAPPRPDQNHPAFKERQGERRAMVDIQLKRHGIKDPNVLRAMSTVPRHVFVPADMRKYAYIDGALAIENGQTISQPYVVAFMTETLKLDPNSRVLEIGTGSGYQAAVCAEIAREVYTIEIVEPLAKTASERLKNLGYANVFVKTGDGYYGWPDKAPFDAIIGTAGAKRIPPPLIEQLKPAGRMVLPVQDSNGVQSLVLVTKDADGSLRKEQILPVRFVPMTGKGQEPGD